ncbi:MAG: hypothetical protein PHQ01_02280 [Candidatus Pacebacteria bacterium]|nr:hypothetical protein [Candidatus Paceibacterota bacterium]
MYKGARLKMVDVKYLWSIGNGYVKSILELGNKGPDYDYLITIDLLSSQALEILLKSYFASIVCLENIDRDEKCLGLILDKMFRDYGHNIKKLLDKDVNLKKNLKIISVEIVRNNFVNDFRVLLENKIVLSFKDLESTRYGTFAKNKNSFSQNYKKEHFEFLENLSEIVKRNIDNTLKKMPVEKIR